MTRTNIIAYIMTQDMVETSDLMDFDDTSRATVYRVLDDLEDEGWIEQTDKGEYEVFDEQDNIDKYWEDTQVNNGTDLSILVDENVTTKDHIADFTNVDIEYYDTKLQNTLDTIDNINIDLKYKDLNPLGRYKHDDRIFIDENIEKKSGKVNSIPTKHSTITHELGHAVDYGSYTSKGDMKDLKLVSEHMIYKNNKYARQSNIESELKKISTRVRGDYNIEVIEKRKIVNEFDVDNYKWSNQSIKNTYDNDDYTEITNLELGRLADDIPKDKEWYFDTGTGEFLFNTTNTYPYQKVGFEFKWSDYRNEPTELFADFVCSMILNPKFTADQAPESVDFFQDIMNHPETYGINRDQERRMKKVWHISEIDNYC